MLGQIQLLFLARFNPRKRLVTILQEESLREDVANMAEDREKERAQTGLDYIRPRSFYLCKFINSLFPNSNLQWILWLLQPKRDSDGPPLEAHLWRTGSSPAGETLTWRTQFGLTVLHTQLPFRHLLTLHSILLSPSLHTSRVNFPESGGPPDTPSSLICLFPALYPRSFPNYP